MMAQKQTTTSTGPLGIALCTITFIVGYKLRVEIRQCIDATVSKSKTKASNFRFVAKTIALTTIIGSTLQIHIRFAESIVGVDVRPL